MKAAATASSAPSTLASFWRRENSQLEPLVTDLEQLSGFERESGARTAYLMFDQRDTTVQHADPSTPWIAWLPLRIGGAEIGAIVGRASHAPARDHDHLEAAKLFS